MLLLKTLSIDSAIKTSLSSHRVKSTNW